MNKYDFTVPENKQLRVIIDTDAGCECDDQFAIAYGLLSPKLKVKGIIATHFADMRGPGSMESGYREVKRILEIMELEREIPFYRGAERPLSDCESIRENEGVDFIIREALRDDPLPLYFLALGPLTNLAVAMIKEPKVASRLKVIWVGGGMLPGGRKEFNLNNDVKAANYIMSSDCPLSSINVECYTGMKIGLAELQYKVKPCGKIGEYLYRQLIDGNERYCAESFAGPDWPLGESWFIADLAAVALALEPHDFTCGMEPAVLIMENNCYYQDQTVRPIKVYSTVNYRYIFEDFFCKLALAYGV